MRKSMAMILALAMAASLTACGGGNQQAATTKAPDTTAAAETTAAADTSKAEEKTEAAAEDPYAALGDFTMMIGHAQPEGNPRYVSMEKFAADVSEKTNGHVTVEVFGNGQLGTEKEMLEQVVAGTIQGMRGGQFDFSPQTADVHPSLLSAEPHPGYRTAQQRPGEEGLRRG